MSWIECDRTTSKFRGKGPAVKKHSLDDPSASVMAEGMGGHTPGDWTVVETGGPDAGAETPCDGDKPRYRVPSMAEVAAGPRNGLTVVSTFAGCGGSSLGYRMAGYRVLWANEFVPAARESYAANMAGGTVLDGRDVRDVRPEEILAACSLEKGELDLLDGSPPCQAFSTAGKRHRGWGTNRRCEGGHEQKNEDLFFEYVRLLRGLMPRVFVAENVSGLVKGVAKGYFLRILGDLKASGYRVEARLLDAQWLGVPQARQRVIFVGVRDDLRLDPAFPSPLPHRYSVREACPWIGSVKSGPTGFGVGDQPAPTVPASMQAPYSAHEVTPSLHQAEWGKAAARGMRRRSLDDPSPLITASVGVLAGGPRQATQVEESSGRRKFTIEELKRICAFPEDFVLTGSYAQQWERLGNSVPPLMMRAVAEVVRDRVLLPAREVRGRSQPAPARTGGPRRRSSGRSTTGSARSGAGRARRSRST